MRNNTSLHEESLLQSVQNALRVLAMFEHQPSIKPAAVGEALGLGRSTVHRLLATLEHEGFVQRDRVQHSYRAGRVLIALGVAAVGDLDVRRKARGCMAELANTTGETVHLFVLEGPNTRIVDGVEGSHSVRVAASIGSLLPAHATAGGKAQLAALPDRELRALFPRGLPSVTATTKTSWVSFEAEMDSIRLRGYAINRGESNDSVWGVAVPILDRARRLVAALALSVPRDRMTDDRAPELAAIVREHAGRIVRTLI